MLEPEPDSAEETALEISDAGAAPIAETPEWEYSEHYGNPYTQKEECILTKYNGDDTVVTIPSEIDGHTIEAIGNNVFKGNTKITAVNIPDSINIIASYAFSGCSKLESLTLPSSVKWLEVGAFDGCTSLRTVSLGSGLELIDDYVFNNCKKITSVELPSSVTKIGYGAFAYCAALESVTFNDGLEKIGDSAFNGCSALTRIEIPPLVEKIGNHTFKDCNKLAYISIPSGCTEIGGYAFQGCDERLVIWCEEGSAAQKFAQSYELGGHPIWCNTLARPTISEVEDSDFGIRVTWNNIYQATSFDVYRSVSTDPEQKFEKVASVPAPAYTNDGTVSWQDEDVRVGVTYTYTVEAVNDSDKSGYWQEGKSCKHLDSASLKSTDFWGFANLALGLFDKITKKHYMRFGVEEDTAKEYARASATNGGGGVCYGMVVAGLSSLLGLTPTVNSYGVRSLYEITKSNYKNVISTTTDLSALEFIKYAFAYQARAMYVYGELDRLYELLVSQNGRGAVHLGLYAISADGRSVESGHAIAALSITDETASEVKVRIYNPNNPGDDRQELTLYKVNGDITGWKFGGYEGRDGLKWSNDGHFTAGENNDLLEYCETEVQNFVNAFNEQAPADERLLFVDLWGDAASAENVSVGNGGSASLVPFSGADESSDTSIYRILGDGPVTVTGVPAGVRVKLSAGNHGVAVTATASSTVVFDVKDQKGNAVQVQPSADASYEITFSDYGAEDETAAFKGSAQKDVPVKAEQSDGGVRLSGASTVEAERQSGDEDEDGNLQNPTVSGTPETTLDPKQTYQIEEGSDGSGLEIKDEKGEAVSPGGSGEESNPGGNPGSSGEGSNPGGSPSGSGEESNPGGSFGEPEKKPDSGKETGSSDCAHSFKWVIQREATAVTEGSRYEECTLCGYKKAAVAIPKLPATIKLNVTSIPLKVKQSTSKVKVSGLAKGDSVKSWESSKPKIAAVNSKGKITGKKVGTAKITVTLASGKTASLTVKVQKKTVQTTKISGLKKNITLKKGKSTKLSPSITPITSQQKVKFQTSNKKVATVNSKGTVKAKKKGTAIITVTSGKKKVKIKVKVK